MRDLTKTEELVDNPSNRTGQTVTHGTGPSSSPTISTSTNRITALGGYTYYYDSNGSLTQDDLFKYKYDAENRVVEIRNLSNTLLSSYAYDGNSMQVIKVVGSTRTWFLYAGGQLVSEFTDAASATYSAGTTPGGAGSDDYATMLYQHADHLTTRVTTDNSGESGSAQAHYPYGEAWYGTGGADPSVKRKFTSYRKETDSSLASGQINYAIARYHGARIGRFHRPDPVRGRVSNPQRLNRYAYVGGNPINRMDPTGRNWLVDFFKGLFGGGDGESSSGSGGSGGGTGGQSDDFAIDEQDADHPGSWNGGGSSGGGLGGSGWTGGGGVFGFGGGAPWMGDAFDDIACDLCILGCKTQKTADTMWCFLAAYWGVDGDKCHEAAGGRYFTCLKKCDAEYCHGERDIFPPG